MEALSNSRRLTAGADKSSVLLLGLTGFTKDFSIGTAELKKIKTEESYYL